MKLISILVLFIMINQNIFAASSDKPSASSTNGGYLGPDIKITDLNGKINTLMGIKGGWFIEKSLLLGGAVYASLNDVDGTEEIFGYGGLYIDYFIGNPRSTRYSFNILLGAGALNYPDANRRSDDDDNFIVVEPGVSTQIYINKYTRLNFGLSYRLVRGSNYLTISNSDLSSISLGLNLSFGKF